jgi:hypothetical protein
MDMREGALVHGREPVRIENPAGAAHALRESGISLRCT